MQDMPETKAWYQSKTIWGALICMAAPLLQHLGLDMAGTDQEFLAEALTTLATTFGGLLALYGRLTASQPVAG